jgi:hypothetical protein
MSISQCVSTCLEQFKDLQHSLHGSVLQHHAVFSSRLNDGLERFQPWTSNIGAHRRDNVSLDHRLRDASHVVTSVLGYLVDIKQALVDGKNMNYSSTTDLKLTSPSLINRCW